MDEVLNVTSGMLNSTAEFNNTVNALVNRSIAAVQNEKLAERMTDTLTWLPTEVLSYIFDLLQLLILLESDTGAAQVPRHSKKAEDDQVFVELEKEQEMLQAQRQPKHKPLTTSIRGTLRYLYFLGGPLGMFRGIHIYLVRQALEWALEWTFEYFLGADLSKNQKIFTSVVQEVLACPLTLIWTWTVLGRTRTRKRGMSTPNSSNTLASLMNSLRRAMPIPPMPSKSAFLQILLPVLLQDLGQQIAKQYWRLDKSLIRSYWLTPVLEKARATVEHQDFSQHNHLLLLGGAAIIEGMLMNVLYFVIQASGMLLYIVYASLLPEDIETIVRYDRSCDGTIQHSPGTATPLYQTYKFLSISKIWRIFKVFVITLAPVAVLTALCAFATRSLLGLEIQFGQNSTV